jgi:radical SAM superfamily enzyme YgiQ (UPF0313 family)
MFKDKKFRVKSEEDVMQDIADARAYYSRVGRIFLCDGDALCLATDKLLKILNTLTATFPECERIGIYGYPGDILRKPEDELRSLKEAGLSIVYIGAESGSDMILKQIHKDVTRAEIIEAVQKAERCGLTTSVTFINGLGGREHWREHAVETGTMIGEMGASYVALLTLMLEPGAPLVDDVRSGKFEVLSGEEIVAETLLMLQNMDVPEETPCVFRSNHASNYVSLRGDLPKDKDRMMDQLKNALAHTELLKDEAFRVL